MEEEFYLNQAMFGDDLYEVKGEEIKSAPHNHIGAITFNTKIHGQVGKGTGILIKKDVVLTAAHNIFHANTNQCYSNFRFFPGASGPLQNGYEVVDFFLPAKYILHPIITNDYALLKLNKEFPTENFIPLSGDISKLTDKILLSIFGYPGDTYVTLDEYNTKFSAKQWGIQVSGRIKEIVNKRPEMKHTISSKAGHSGAPIIARDSQGNLTIVAIHTSEVAKKQGEQPECNSSRLITDELINIINLETQRMEVSQGANIQQQLQQNQLINQLVQQNQHLTIKNKELISKLSAMEMKMMPEKGLEQFQDIEQKLENEIKWHQEKVEHLVNELKRIKEYKQPQPQHMQVPIRKETIEGNKYDETTQKLSKLTNQEQVTHLSIHDTMYQPDYEVQCWFDAGVYKSLSRVYTSVNQMYFTAYSEYISSHAAFVPKFADELSHFTSLQFLTFSFKHVLVSRNCFGYLAEKINSLKNLQQVELRIPNYYKQYNQKENWTTELKVKVITYY